MDEMQLNVLLLGENQAGWVCLQKRLEQRGCRCWFARSPKEALAPHGPRAYGLILSSVPVARIDASLSDLGGAPSSVFCCYPVEDGCWWLPVVRHGRKCFGAPGVRGAEFLEILDQMIRELRSQAVPSGEPRRALESAAHG